MDSIELSRPTGTGHWQALLLLRQALGTDGGDAAEALLIMSCDARGTY